MERINILGAGISGLSAAINLAKKGYNVEIFEKRSDCGKRFLGDLEGLENWSSKIDTIKEINLMNIKTNFDCKPYNKLFVSEGKEVLEVNLKKPMFYLVKRGAIPNSIDQGLKNQALDQGVKIHFNKKISKENMDIISTGPAGQKYFAVAKGIRFESNSDDIAFLLLHNEASANGAYSYLLISDGHGCICSVNVYLKGSETKKYYNKTYELITNLVDIDIRNEKNVGGLGCFQLSRKLVSNGKIYTGEAAGLQDLLWGFGMRYALISGYFASKSISENKSYKRLIRKNLNKRLKTSVVNRYLTDKYYKYVHDYIIGIVKSDTGNWMDILYERYNPTLYSRILYPIAIMQVSKRFKNFHNKN
jgi:flavin-dependent dehydrogenase